MSVTPPAADAERDAWLRQALRHAPDADLLPPPALSALILREAQAKARVPTSPTPLRSRWHTRVWGWMARPAVGAGVASVMLAGVIGVMWWDRPLQEFGPRDKVAAPLPAPLQSASDAALEDSVASQAERAAPPVAQAKPKTLVPSRRATPTTPTTAAAAPQAPIRPTTPAAAHDHPSPPAKSEVAAPADASAARDATMAGALAAPQAAVASESRARTSASAAERSLVGVRGALATEPHRWTWRRADMAARPVDERLTAWLAEVDAVTSAHWRAAATPAPPDNAGDVAVQLLRDGQVMHTLRLGDGQLQWDQAGDAAASRHWQAPLADAEQRRLRSGLESIGR